MTKGETKGVPKGFFEEFVSCWHELPNKFFFLGLLSCWVLLFHFLGNSTFGYFNTDSLFEWMYGAYNSPGADDDHGLLIPFVVLGLLWWKRSKLLSLPKKNWWPGLILLGFSVCLHVFGYLIQQPRASIVAFFVGIYALAGLAWGLSWLKETFFPFVLFSFCVPLSTLEVMKNITLPLRLLAASVSQGIANIGFGLDVVRQGTQVFNSTGSYSYDVAAACSGIRSLTSLVVLMIIYAMMTFKNPLKRTAVILTAIPIAILCNIIRLLTVIFAAEAFGQSTGDVVHEWSGFFTYALAVIAMLVISYFWREKEPSARLVTSPT